MEIPVRKAIALGTAKPYRVIRDCKYGEDYVYAHKTEKEMDEFYELILKDHATAKTKRVAQSGGKTPEQVITESYKRNY